MPEHTSEFIPEATPLSGEEIDAVLAQEGNVDQAKAEHLADVITHLPEELRNKELGERPPKPNEVAVLDRQARYLRDAGLTKQADEKSQLARKYDSEITERLNREGLLYDVQQMGLEQARYILDIIGEKRSLLYEQRTTLAEGLQERSRTEQHPNETYYEQNQAIDAMIKDLDAQVAKLSAIYNDIRPIVQEKQEADNKAYQEEQRRKNPGHLINVGASARHGL